jgi:hypothetical protein
MLTTRQPPSTIAEGLFEARVLLEAYCTYREFHPLDSGSVFTRFLTEMPDLADGRLAEHATVIGTWLGVAVSIWNDIGSQASDIWDMHASGDNSPAGFLRFFAHCQRVRNALPGAAKTELAVKSIIFTLARPTDARREPFDAGSPESSVLAAVGVSRRCLSELPSTFARWRAIEQMPSWFEGKGDREHLDVALAAASRNGADIEWTRHRSHSACDVEVRPDGRDGVVLRPRLTLEHLPDAGGPSLLVGFHELGHFVLHVSWIAELSLMRHAAETVTAAEPILSRRLMSTVEGLARRLTTTCAAFEEAADRFAISCMHLESLLAVPDASAIEQVFGALHDVPFDPRRGVLCGFRRRFHRHLAPYDPRERDLWPIAAMYHQLRAILREVSRQRVEHLIASTWVEILNKIESEEH